MDEIEKQYGRNGPWSRKMMEGLPTDKGGKATAREALYVPQCWWLLREDKALRATRAGNGCQKKQACVFVCEDRSSHFHYNPSSSYLAQTQML